MTGVLTNHLLPLLEQKAGHHTLHSDYNEASAVVPTCLPGGFCREVSRELLEDVGHLLLHEKADEVGGCVEL